MISPQIASQKADNIMFQKYNMDWIIKTVDEEGKEHLEVKDEYISEYDKLFELFLLGNDETSDNKECESKLSSENS